MDETLNNTVLSGQPAGLAPEEDSGTAREDVSNPEETAAIAGLSGIYDAYGREILEPTFENILTLSKNIVKLNYSRLKNAVNTYKNIRSAFVNAEETMSGGDKPLFVFRVNGDQILLYCAVPSAALDRTKYPHKATPKKEARAKELPVLLTVRKPESLKKAIDVIAIVMDKNGIPKANVAAPKAYGEMYPVNPNAVLRGSEDTPPAENKYGGKDYEDIIGELTAAIMEAAFGKPDRRRKKPKGEAALEKQRQTSKTVKGAIALAQPVVYFYEPAVDRANNVQFIHVQQVLNDKFLGKLIPPHYFAVAEGSERIETLNLLALKEVAGDCERQPDTVFAVRISSRMLLKQETLNRLLKIAKNGQKNMMLILDAAQLEDIGETGQKAVQALRAENFLIMVENVENAGIKTLTEYEIDYMRLDARYYPVNDTKRAAQLKLFTGYAKTLGIKTAAQYAETVKDCLYLFSNGVEIVEGYAIGEPRRIAQVAVKERKRLPVAGG